MVWEEERNEEERNEEEDSKVDIRGIKWVGWAQQVDKLGSVEVKLICVAGRKLRISRLSAIRSQALW
jgi:hypothetical protein